MRRWLKACRWLAVPAALATLAWILCPRPSLYGDLPFSTAIQDRNGELLRLTLAADERYRLRTPLADIAPAMLDATLHYEDRQYYRHAGINPAAVLRAAWTTYVKRERVVGASTITMQLARMRYGIDTRTVRGKLVQMLRALQFERHYSKQDILEAYLNLAPYGGNIEGAGAASLVYFGKPAAELTQSEAFLLAVVPQNPAKRTPSANDGYPIARNASQRLYALWTDEHDASPGEVARFQMPLAIKKNNELPFAAPHFVNDVDGSIDAAGVVRTTLDLMLQRKFESIVSDYIARYDRRGLRNASAMLIDRRSMEVLAAIGSADFFAADIQGQVNGTRAQRSPGSTLKPFVYGLAIDQGLIHPLTLLKDAPARYAAYTPENFDRGFMGPVHARDALVYSRNVPAIELLLQTGTQAFHQFLTAAGVERLREPEFYGLAAVLGGIELTMEDLVELYAMLANRGVHRPLRKIFDEQRDEKQRLLSAEASYLVLDMLFANPRPDALGFATGNERRVAWKTGTSYAFRDAWSVGVMGDYVLAVWVGNFDGTSNPALVGREAAAPLFFSLLDALPYEHRPFEPSPDMNLRKVSVCSRTGDLATPLCPQVEDAWFIPGVSPIRASNVHRVVNIDPDSGLRVCGPPTANSVQTVYEFWPSDISQLFRRAGMAIRQPPPYPPGCTLAQTAAAGRAPAIHSVNARLVYQLRGDDDPLPLAASADADASFLYWFVDEHFVGRTAVGETAYWQADTGEHRLLVVDDLGRSDSLLLKIARPDAAGLFDRQRTASRQAR